MEIRIVPRRQPESVQKALNERDRRPRHYDTCHRRCGWRGVSVSAEAMREAADDHEDYCQDRALREAAEAEGDGA